MLIQAPPPGSFTVHDLRWQQVQFGCRPSLAAAVPMNRVPDFQEGESQRGMTRVHLYVHHAAKEGTCMMLDKRGTCIFAAPRKVGHQARQSTHVSAPPEAYQPGAKPRCSKLQLGTSCKKGCTYKFTAKSYARAAGVAILKFACEPGDTTETCAAMQHLTAAGCVAHTGADTHHLWQHNEDVTDLIISQLKTAMKPALIKAGVLCCAVLACAAWLPGRPVRRRLPHATVIM